MVYAVGWVRNGYKGRGWVVFLRDEEEKPRGTFVSSMKFFLTIEAKTLLPPRSNLFRGKALPCRRWGSGW